MKCVAESIYLANIDQSLGRNGASTPDILMRDAAGMLHFLAVKGPFAIRIEDLLDELARKRPA